mgnify:CR=1 FL=1
MADVWFARDAASTVSTDASQQLAALEVSDVLLSPSDPVLEVPEDASSTSAEVISAAPVTMAGVRIHRNGIAHDTADAAQEVVVGEESDPS